MQKLAKTAGRLSVAGGGFICADVYTDFSLKSAECNQEILKVRFSEIFFLRIEVFKRGLKCLGGAGGMGFHFASAAFSRNNLRQVNDVPSNGFHCVKPG